MMLRVASVSARAVARARPMPTSASARGLSSLQPMDEEYLGTPNTMPTAASAPVTKVSTLSNGATVVTRESGQMGAAIGLVVGSGSRDESPSQTGASLHMEGMAFKLTEERSSIRLMRDVESVGGSLAASGGREKMMYVSECPPDSAAVVLSALAESAIAPKIVPWEVDDAKSKIEGVLLKRYEEDVAAQAEEALHAAAFGDAYTLGKPLFSTCGLSANGVKEFHDARFKAPAITVVGVNVAHEDLKGAAEEALEAADTTTPPAREPAKYVGGELRVKIDGASHTSVSMAYAAPGGSDNSAAACEVLGAILSARVDAAAPHGPAAMSSSGFCISYSDAGLLGVTGTCAPGYGGALASALASCLKGLADVSKDEVEAAIVSAKIARALRMEKPLHAMLTLADSAAVGADPSAIDSALDGVSVSDVEKAAAAAAESGLSVAAVGHVTEVPSKKELEDMV